MADLLELRADGLYSEAGGFYVDPWRPVDLAVITHAHPDRARPGSREYLCSAACEPLLRELIGPVPNIQILNYGKRLAIGGTTVSLHPSGHMLGAAQVRIERGGEVWAISGDFKLSPDPACAPFEPVRCRVFLTEATFGLPVFRWPDEAETMAAIHSWWRANRDAGKVSLLYAYPLGEAQRILASLDRGTAPVYCDAAIARFNAAYGLAAEPIPPGPPAAGSLIFAPPSARNTAAVRRYAPLSSALASGWMRIRGARRRQALDRGFVLSSHADWPALLRAIDETGAETVWVTHGFRRPLVRWLEERGRHALAIDAQYEGEREEDF